MSLSSEILDLKNKTSDWNLECDKSLFAIVEKLSENTLNRINDLNAKMKDINFETQKTFCNTNHLFSDIYNMANQKFIEMSTKPFESQEVVSPVKNDKIKESENQINIYHQAFRNGLNVFNKTNTNTANLLSNEKPENSIISMSFTNNISMKYSYLPYIYGSREYVEKSYILPFLNKNIKKNDNSLDNSQITSTPNKPLTISNLPADLKSSLPGTSMSDSLKAKAENFIDNQNKKKNESSSNLNKISHPTPPLPPSLKANPPPNPPLSMKVPSAPFNAIPPSTIPPPPPFNIPPPPPPPPPPLPSSSLNSNLLNEKYQKSSLPPKILNSNLVRDAELKKDYEKAIDHNSESDSEQPHSRQNIKKFLNAQFKIKQTENLFDENKEDSNSDDDELLKALQKNKNKEEEQTEVHQRVQLTNRTSMKHQDFENFEKREEKKKLKETLIENEDELSFSTQKTGIILPPMRKSQRPGNSPKKSPQKNFDGPLERISRNYLKNESFENNDDFFSEFNKNKNLNANKITVKKNLFDEDEEADIKKITLSPIPKAKNLKNLFEDNEDDE